MKKEDVSQLTLRVDDSVITRLKLRAKAESMSVNSLATAMIENGLATHDDNAEFYQLIASPVDGLSRIHRKICDPWGTGTISALSVNEIKFIADGALKGLNATLLAGEFYDVMRKEAQDVLEETRSGVLFSYQLTEPYLVQVLFSFALRYYVEDINQRTDFAARNAPDGIETASYDLEVNDMKFTFIVSGNEMNRFKSPDEYIAPTMFLLFKSQYIEARHYWDTISALARILEAVKLGKPFESRPGAQALLAKDRGQPDSWLLLLGRIQLRLTGGELDELAQKFMVMAEGVAARPLREMRLLYGEG